MVSTRLRHTEHWLFEWTMALTKSGCCSSQPLPRTGKVFMLFFSNPHTRAPLFIPTDQKTPPCRQKISAAGDISQHTMPTTSKQLKDKKNKMDEKEERPSCVSVRCCPKQWPCTTRVRQRRDEEEKASCDCTDMILNDRVCVGTKLTCLGANDRKEARPQPSMPEEVHIGHYILSRVCSCCGISVSEKEGECGDGGGGTTCAWLDVKPVGHGLFDAASVLEALYNHGPTMVVSAFRCLPSQLLEDDELEAMAKKGERRRTCWDASRLDALMRRKA